jgi:hypothetical protein
MPLSGEMLIWQVAAVSEGLQLLRRTPAMLTRTQRTTVVFRRPFPLKNSGGVQPAGTYTVETEEELLEGLSFPAYRRVSTTITRQPTRAGASVEVLPVDPRELAEAQAADKL